MPKTPQQPPLSDWQVALAPLGDSPYADFLTVRATSLIVVSDAVFLQDVRGGILFTAPLAAVRYVKRLEPGEDLPAAKEEPKTIEVPADPGPVEVTPAPRPRTARRGK
jgi:hypothetical protein